MQFKPVALIASLGQCHSVAFMYERDHILETPDLFLTCCYPDALIKQNGRIKWKLHTDAFLCIRRQGGSSRDLGTPVIRHVINLTRVLSGLVWKTVTYLPQGTKGILVEMAEFRDYGWHWELLWKSGVSTGEEESPDKVSNQGTLATGGYLLRCCW